jgi:starch synthase
LKILIVSAEFAPLAKTGGLADAVAGLSAALGAAGHDVRVLLPRYGRLAKAAPIVDTATHASSKRRYVEVRAAFGAGRIYLLDAPEQFGAEPIYWGDDRDAVRFLALCEAATSFAETLGWRPDVVHCHDWHAALVPVLLGELPPAERPPSVLTLHNVSYQGVFASSLVISPRHPVLDAHIDATATPPAINFLRAGVRTADLLTTVSPTYAEEIQTTAYGMGLEDLLQARGADLFGILNGVDYSVWDPSADPYLDVHYERADPTPKRQLKHNLCDSLALECGAGDPLIGVVTRLVPQKGIDLLAAILPSLLVDSNARFALLGSGDPVLEQKLASLAADAPERVSFTLGYDEALAHRILAGSDIVLVPSRYEPCGLTQLYAMRYGTIPVVRATGGLADTVKHFDPASGVGTGSVFEHADPPGLAWGIGQALEWFGDSRAWQHLLDNAMAGDFSWRRQVGHYLGLYERLLAGH